MTTTTILEFRRQEALRAIAAHAETLVRCVGLELSGVRDGDGYWCGSDPLNGTLHAMTELHSELRSIERSQYEATTEHVEAVEGLAF